MKTLSDALAQMHSHAKRRLGRTALGVCTIKPNRGRCHAPAQKFPPRTMATVLRDMQVRATITDEDMRLVLHVTVTLNVTVWKKTDDSITQILS
jgi:hypothetical protein